MPSYKVKTPVSNSPTQAPKKSATKTFKAGDSIDLSEKEAYEIGHALEEPPGQDPDQEGEPLDQEILDSIKNNPENPSSGVEHYWKTRPDISVRPEENKSELEKELEPEREQGEAKAKAGEVKRLQPGMPARPASPGTSQTANRPVVPAVTRPEPKK